MLTCKEPMHVWKACTSFCNNILNEQIRLPLEAAVFNVPNHHSKKLISLLAQAVFRHAVGQWYADMTAVGTRKAIFHWQSTFYNALLRLRAALLRFAYAIRRLHVQRAYTNLTNVVDDMTRAQFSPLLTLNRDGTCTLTATFLRAIDAAKTAHETRRQQEGMRG